MYWRFVVVERDPTPCSRIACVPNCSCGQTLQSMPLAFFSFARASLVPPVLSSRLRAGFHVVALFGSGFLYQGLLFCSYWISGLECRVKLFSVSMKPGLILPVFLSPSVRVNFFSRSVFATSHWPLGKKKILPKTITLCIGWLHMSLLIFFISIRYDICLSFYVFSWCLNETLAL